MPHDTDWGDPPAGMAWVALLFILLCVALWGLAVWIVIR